NIILTAMMNKLHYHSKYIRPKIKNIFTALKTKLSSISINKNSNQQLQEISLIKDEFKDEVTEEEIQEILNTLNQQIENNNQTSTIKSLKSTSNQDEVDILPLPNVPTTKPTDLDTTMKKKISAIPIPTIAATSTKKDENIRQTKSISNYGKIPSPLARQKNYDLEGRAKKVFNLLNVASYIRNLESGELIYYDDYLQKIKNMIKQFEVLFSINSGMKSFKDMKRMTSISEDAISQLIDLGYINKNSSAINDPNPSFNFTNDGTLFMKKFAVVFKNYCLDFPMKKSEIDDTLWIDELSNHGARSKTAAYYAWIFFLSSCMIKSNSKIHPLMAALIHLHDKDGLPMIDNTETFNTVFYAEFINTIQDVINQIKEIKHDNSQNTQTTSDIPRVQNLKPTNFESNPKLPKIINKTSIIQNEKPKSLSLLEQIELLNENKIGQPEVKSSKNEEVNTLKKKNIKRKNFGDKPPLVINDYYSNTIDIGDRIKLIKKLNLSYLNLPNNIIQLLFLHNIDTVNKLIKTDIEQLSIKGIGLKSKQQIKELITYFNHLKDKTTSIDKLLNKEGIYQYLLLGGRLSKDLDSIKKLPKQTYFYLKNVDSRNTLFEQIKQENSIDRISELTIDWLLDLVKINKTGKTQDEKELLISKFQDNNFYLHYSNGKFRKIHYPWKNKYKELNKQSSYSLLELKSQIYSDLENIVINQKFGELDI
ncbi:MAG: hypothetical protein OEZ01_07640, partial [Candidatus Heimdallarchaeota archaeon]|nr:hypothetical protein [Candidatus Heimdallarchaeota archaeon]